MTKRDYYIFLSSHEICRQKYLYSSLISQNIMEMPAAKKKKEEKKEEQKKEEKK